MLFLLPCGNECTNAPKHENTPYSPPNAFTGFARAARMEW